MFASNRGFRGRTTEWCQSNITTADPGCHSIWSHLSSISKTSSIHIQWIPSHIGITGNTLADLEAKRCSTLPQTSVPVDLATATVLLRRIGQEEFQTRYKRDTHSATHSTLNGDTNLQAHWRFGWTRSQCITIAQLRTGHCPLLASYLHRIGQQQSPVCPYCDDTASSSLLSVACIGTHFYQLHQLNWSSMQVVFLELRERERGGGGDRQREREQIWYERRV